GTLKAVLDLETPSVDKVVAALDLAAVEGSAVDVATSDVATSDVATSAVATSDVATSDVATSDVATSAVATSAVTTSEAATVDQDFVQTTVDAFHCLYYARLEQTWTQTFWMGIKVLKCPLDLWIYQEILYEVRPDLIVECGTYKGGSALFLAGMCDLLGHGEVLTIDVDLQDRPSHPRLHYLTGSSTSPEVLQAVALRAGAGSVLVILDSDHSCAHVLEELRGYRQVVTPGSY